MGRIIGIGVDIVKIERFKKSAESPHFLKRVFTDYEQEYLSKKGPETMAGLFAAKEAVVKALGTGFAGFWPCEIEIMHCKSGKPYAVLHGKAKDMLAGSFTINISISHNETDAIAFAVIEG